MGAKTKNIPGKIKLTKRRKEIKSGWKNAINLYENNIITMNQMRLKFKEQK